MRGYFSWLVAAALLTFAGSAAAAPITLESLYQDAPEWVVQVDPVTPDETQLSPSDGQRYLLIDRQWRIDDSTPQYWARTVIEAETVNGVESASEIQIQIDPSFETLHMTGLYVIRDGQRIDHSQRAHVEVLRTEPDLGNGIYQGTETLYIRLEDVRAGDIVDYSYVSEGRNPAYAGHAFHIGHLNWGVDVERLHRRTVLPKDREHQIKLRGTDITPVKSELEDNIVYTIGPVAAEKVKYDAGAPDWYRAQGTFEISDFADWSGVIELGKSFFDGQTEAALEEVITKIRTEHDTDEARILAALRFVQDDIRYHSIALGQGGFIPRDPAIVLETRFGDCKEKTQLFVLMARALGATSADPALVDSTEGPDITNRLPSLGAFDHVITRLVLGEETYWIDATRRFQRGSLATLAKPWFGVALVLAEGESELSEMPMPSPEKPLVEIHDRFDLSAGVGEDVIMTATSTYRGVRADRLRAQLADDGQQALEENYIRFYEKWFGEVTLEDPLEVTDNLAANEIIIREHLRLIEAYEPYDKTDTGQYEFDFKAYALGDVIDTDAPKRRKAPLEVYPGVHSVHKTTVKLTNNGRDWALENQDKDISNPAFDFTYKARKRGDTWTMTRTLKTKLDHVPAKDARSILKDHDQLDIDEYWSLLLTPPAGYEDITGDSGDDGVDPAALPGTMD